MDIIDIFNKEEEKKEKSKIAPTKEYFVSAYQLRKKVRKNKGGVYVTVIEVIDTIIVERGETERAKNRAYGKGKRIGNCFVVELCERSIACFTDEPKVNPEEEKIDNPWADEE